ncbi:MAG: hypothetical protein NTW86_18155 [Candidatus Sumerlaeota bacterium]|nr:hypothetical protein [Candidatus Sumerlaeota bacterium]
MTKKTYDIELRGPKVSKGRKSPDAIGSTLKWFELTTVYAVSVAFRFCSRMRGRRPDWLAAASAVNFTGLSNGGESTRLYFEAPLLGEAAADLYAQREMFEEIRPGEQETAFDLLARVVVDIRRQAQDSARFDSMLLRQFEVFKNAARWGLESLALEGESLPDDHPFLVDREICEFAENLHQGTPRPRRARIAGTLDMIRASDGAFSLILKSGEMVHGVMDEERREALRKHWQRYVKVEGKAVFRPSGSLLCLEAEDIAPATESDDFFATVPRGIPTRLDMRALRQPQTPRSGMARFFGCWPGDETEEEILAALEEIC